MSSDSELMVDGLVGLWFHSMRDDGRPAWQGLVVDRPEPGLFLVQPFSLLDGGPGPLLLVSSDEMHDWQFYRNEEDMKEWYRHQCPQGLFGASVRWDWVEF